MSDVAQAAANKNPPPMELSAHEFGAFQRDKSKGKAEGNLGTGELPKTPCPICNKLGHWKQHCWYNTSDAARSKGSWNFNAAGHVAKNCPKKKPNLSAIDGDDPNDSMMTYSQPANLSAFLLLNALETMQIEQFSDEHFSHFVWIPESTVARLDELFAIGTNPVATRKATCRNSSATSDHWRSVRPEAGVDRSQM